MKNQENNKKPPKRFEKLFEDFEEVKKQIQSIIDDWENKTNTTILFGKPNERPLRLGIYVDVDNIKELG